MVGSRRVFRGRIVGFVAFIGFVAASAAASAGSDDRGTTDLLLKEVETSPRKDAADDLVRRSRMAAGRATKLRAAGDEAHAKLADALARTWAEAARDVVHAAVVEKTATTERDEATDAGVLADRERAQLEEAIAQSGRLRAQLEALEREGTERPAHTSTAAASADGDPRAQAKPAASTKAAPGISPKADGGAQ